MRLLSLFGTLIVLVLITPAPRAWAEDKEEEATPEEEFIYQWTDEEGVIHFVDALSKVPASYRAGPGLRKIPVGPAESDTPPSHTTPGSGSGAHGSRTIPHRDDEEPTPEPLSPEERRRELIEQRDDLMIRINQLEEGFADPGHADRDDEELERLLDQSEKLLDRVEREIRKLEAARDR